MLGSWFTPRSANQCRAPLVDFFNHAAAKSLCPDNPAASTIKRVEKKQRKRHTVEGLKAIREKVACLATERQSAWRLSPLSGGPTS
ncbi:MAG: hypothetical protein A2W79_26140 [Pseudomonadales bacterium RIFCSPLOWO2_12_60_38]|uniref:hypothetical protein n=1 Tax=Pseudomonas paracarnis TaxID=2750625 RepID=UPI0003DB9DB5|nr:hypothetical protein H098_05125 [Pseudomonas fluorescens FH5]OHC34926.1 MAG: hypothetical protein A2W79_26140 [Pseudomonadales bacterium RIFCSPLOWO2_12_60_38]OHC37071.1 MAG: hypothetical protein A3G72_05985 [Pseudomonadales bacterium RIFCSPLOWO2_12_FULL_59_450]